MDKLVVTVNYLGVVSRTTGGFYGYHWVHESVLPCFYPFSNPILLDDSTVRFGFRKMQEKQAEKKKNHKEKQNIDLNEINYFYISIHLFLLFYIKIKYF